MFLLHDSMLVWYMSSSCVYNTLKCMVHNKHTYWTIKWVLWVHCFMQIASWFVILLRGFSTGYHVEIYSCKLLQWRSVVICHSSSHKELPLLKLVSLTVFSVSLLLFFFFISSYSISLCYQQVSLSVENDNFRLTMELPENWSLVIVLATSTAVQNMVPIRLWGGFWRNGWNTTKVFMYIFFEELTYRSDRFRNFHARWLKRRGCSFLAFCRYCSHLG